MKRFILIFVLGVLFLSACQPSDAPPPDLLDTPAVSVEEESTAELTKTPTETPTESPTLVAATETMIPAEATTVEEPTSEADESGPKRTEPVSGEHFVNDDPSLVGNTGNPQLIEFYTDW